MKTELANNPFSERYVVEIDGNRELRILRVCKSTDGWVTAEAGVSEQPRQITRC